MPARREEYKMRPYAAGDHGAVMNFLNRTLADLGHEFLPDGKDADIRDLEHVYLDHGGAFHVVEFNEEIVGSVGVRRCSSHIAELKRLYVGREHRGLTLGRGLCETAISNAKSLGYARLRLDTTTTAVAALDLFRKLGFCEIPRYNTDPYAEIWMERSL